MAFGAACFRQQLGTCRSVQGFACHKVAAPSCHQKHIPFRIGLQSIVAHLCKSQQGFCVGAQANHVHVSAPALSAQQRRIELPVLVYPGAAIDGHLVAAVC